MKNGKMMFRILVFVAVCLTVQAAKKGLSRGLGDVGSFRLVDFVNGDFERDSPVATLTRERRQSGRGSCRSGQWQCRDKSCIDWDLVCDGATDCPDKSDESQAICRKRRCASHLYQCSYGACVDGTAKCDGVQDCADGSDELNKDCVRNVTSTVVNKCGKGKFQCLQIQQCIEADELCDGRVDCQDKSDETVYQCSSRKCASFLDRCAYGACVDGGSKCNNVVDCADGSDEDPALCAGVPGWIAQVTTTPTPLTSKPTTRPPPVGTTAVIPDEGGCILPDYPEGGTYKILGNSNVVPGQVVPLFTYLQYSCKYDYDLSTIAAPLCEENNDWSVRPLCNRKCKMVTSYTVDFTCRDPTYNVIPCATTLPFGTIIESKCKSGHASTEYLEVLKCGGGGSWDNTTPKCKPDCGLEKSLGVTYVVKGQTAKKDTFPWHVGIFQQDGEKIDQICGGSLIHSHIVISAGHCFWDPIKNQPIAAIYYKVAAGKFYRDWDHEKERESRTIQRSEVTQILFHERYGGDEQNQQSDLALVLLTTPFSFSDSVSPVCYDLYNEQLNNIQTADGVLGKVAGWGRTETGDPSSELKTLTIPVINYNECRIELSKYKFTRYLTTDKMCAGYTNGSALCQGDSGGGFVVAAEDLTKQKRWYLRGIVSNGPLNDAQTSCRANTYTGFTQIYKLRDWVLLQLRRLT